MNRIHHNAVGILMGIWFSTVTALAQGTIVGKTVNADNDQPLAGASVIVLGTNIGASSDASGRFTLQNVPVGTRTIVVRYVGFQTLRVQVKVIQEEAVALTLRLKPESIILTPIIVNAMRAEERTSPVTFSDIDAQAIKERYAVQDVPELLSELPSTIFYSENGNGIGYNHLYIRGFDQRRLAVLINGVPQNDPEDHDVYWIDFPDLLASTSQIQVQRGAGSAFYGPPAIGGSVNLVTAAVTTRPAISVTAGYGSFNTRRYAVSLNSGLIANHYAISARLSKISSSGYRNQSWTDFSSYYISATRYDSTLTTQFNFYGGPIADGLAYSGLPKFFMSNKDLRRLNYSYWEASGDSVTFALTRRPEEIENFSQPHYELLNEWRISPTLRLNSALFYIYGAGFFDYDGSWADTSYFRLTSEYGFHPTGNPQNALIRAYVEGKQFGILPRLTWTYEHGELVAGAELRKYTGFHWGRIQWAENLPEGLNADFHYYEFHRAKEVASLYLHEVYSLHENLTAMADLQFIFNQYHFYDEKFLGTEFIVPYRFLNPRIGLNWNITEAWSMYANLSRTSREPRLNNLYNAGEVTGGATPMFGTNPDGTYNFGNPLVRPETLDDIEVGIRFTREDFPFGANLYLMNFRNEIIKQGQLDRFGRPITGNAERTIHQGLELTGSITEIVKGLSISGNLSLSRNRLVRYTIYRTVRDSTGKKTIAVRLDGNRIADFPDALGNLRITYKLGGLNASLLLQYVGNQYTDNFQRSDRMVDPYTVLNGFLTYRLNDVFGFRGFEFRLQINNILNKLYVTHGEGDEFFPAATRNIFAAITVDL
ncbi:MAG: TonB-dependent receptor [Bacteroidota bacterium]